MADCEQLERRAEANRLLWLAIRDAKERASSLEKLEGQVEAWVDGASGGGTRSVLVDIVPVLLRQSLSCPYQDVRDKCAEILATLKQSGSSVKLPGALNWGPSYFIPPSEIVPVSNNTDDDVFIESFLQNNRLEHLHQVMGYHPKYLKAFVKAQQYLLRDDGPLPFHFRHYIAIMAASRHQCLYLVRLHMHEFLACGGDSSWLGGLDFAPQKLRNLSEINKILAHQPWLIRKGHIEKLTRGGDTWSLSELMQAIIILVHFHAICSFVSGCGICPELDQGGATLPPTNSSGDESEDYSSDSGNETNANVLEETSIHSLMLRMRELRETSSQEEPTQEELIKRFQMVETQSLEISVPSVAKVSSSRKEDVSRFVTESDFTYMDFAQRCESDGVQTFRIQDFNWEDQGFSLANRLYDNIGSYLDKRFNVALELTYYTMGNNCEVDTTAFRMAIWNYIHCMYGIRHDDYDYRVVNALLERNLKAYIKTVTCYPERITRKDYEGVMRAFKHSEKVHVNLMMTEARMQAELLYALRAVKDHINTRDKSR